MSYTYSVWAYDLEVRMIKWLRIVNDW